MKVNSKYLLKKSILGNVNPEYFETILENLAETYSFIKFSSSSTLPSNVGIQESALFEEFTLAFESLAKNGNFDSFFKEIQLTDSHLQDICIKCPDFDKVNWHSISKITNCSREELKASFRSWLDSQQNLKEKCSTLSFTSLLKAIKKTLKH